MEEPANVFPRTRMFIATWVLSMALVLVAGSSHGRADDKPVPGAAPVLAPPSPDQSAPPPGAERVREAPAKKNRFDPRNLCVTYEDAASELSNKRRHIGGRIVLDTFLLPTGGTVDVGLDETFSETDYYFGALDIGKAQPILLDRPVVRARQASDSDSLVKKGLIGKDRTLLSVKLPDVLNAPWGQANFYLFTCRDGSPYEVSETSVVLSPALYSSVLAWLFVFAGYLIAVFAFRAEQPANWYSYLNPIPITAGLDGKASLGKLQILMFSLIVFGLISYFVLKTGGLSDISSTILLLLGITGVGSTIAKGADISRTTITPQNRAWLLRKQWLPSSLNPATTDPHWRDLFTTDGEFDVYRYQSFIFSLVVGCALIIGGVTQLSSFEIPQTLLGILGLSQVVYISGKLVTPTSMADLNKLIADLREAEKKFRAAAIQANSGVVPANMSLAITPSSQLTYDAYMTLATDVATLFTAQTSIAVPLDRLQPSL